MTGRFQIHLRVTAAEETQSVDTLDFWVQRPLAERLRDSTFTPFIGYGAVQSGLQATDPARSDCLRWDTGVEERIEAIARVPGAEGSPHPDPAKLRAFLDHLCADRKDGRLSVRGAEPRDGVTDLRFACMKLAFVATEAFVEGWREHFDPVSDWNRHQVTLTGPALRTVQAAMEHAIDMGTALQDLPNHDPETLGLKGLLRRLCATKEEVDAGELSGTLVEWFTDVFWHTMTFDSEVYPRISELATQVSLMIGSAEPRRHTIPIGRIQRGEYCRLVDTVAKAMARGVSPQYASEERRSFLLALADVAHRMHAKWARVVLPEPSRYRSTFHTQPSLLLTSSLGLDVEFALASSTAAEDHPVFHVAIPVIVEDSPEGSGMSRGRLRWVVGDFPVVGAGESPTRSVLTHPQGAGWRWLDGWVLRDELGPRLQGPLLLKIGGSPLHDLSEELLPDLEPDDSPDAADVAAIQAWDEERGVREPVELSVDRGRITHALALDEFDVIQRTAYELYRMQSTIGSEVKEKLPDWLRESINSGYRSWVYFGLRMTDWNSRMELILNRLAWTPDSRKSDVVLGPVAIGRKVSADQARLLSLLGITPITGDCMGLKAQLVDLANKLTVTPDAPAEFRR